MAFLVPRGATGAGKRAKNLGVLPAAFSFGMNAARMGNFPNFPNLPNFPNFWGLGGDVRSPVLGEGAGSCTAHPHPNPSSAPSPVGPGEGLHVCQGKANISYLPLSAVGPGQG